jgi:hypothetical protein
MRLSRLWWRGVRRELTNSVPVIGKAAETLGNPM